MTDTNEIQATILAAGKGERIGTPKAFLRYNDSTFVEVIYRRLRSAGYKKVTVVTSYEQLSDLEQLELPEIEVVINFTPHAGQFSSIRLAVIAQSRSSQGMLLVPVDHPAVESTTYRELFNKWLETKRRTTIIPVYQRRKGHPVIIPSTLFASIVQASPEMTLRNLIREDEESIQYLDVMDDGVVRNINTKKEYESLCRFLEQEEE